MKIYTLKQQIIMKEYFESNKSLVYQFRLTVFDNLMVVT